VHQWAQGTAKSPQNFLTLNKHDLKKENLRVFKENVIEI
jgi:hypothetical protein